MSRPSVHELLLRSGLGCPVEPPCTHLLSQHAARDYDDRGDPIDPRCTAVGCDCPPTPAHETVYTQRALGGE